MLPSSAEEDPIEEDQDAADDRDLSEVVFEHDMKMVLESGCVCRPPER
jgi:hypothetical protein